MRTYTVTKREGENMGPIDWSYNFRPHFDCMGTSTEGKDAACARSTERLRMIEQYLKDGVPICATTDGGSPRCGIGRVLDIGMYDGYPYWRPVPSVLINGWMGASWSSFDRITDIYPGRES
jgi:hypothetical protein